MDSAAAVSAYPWLQAEFFGNSVRAYAFSLAFILIGGLLVWSLDRIVLRRMLRAAERTRSGFDDFLVLSFKSFVVPALYAVVAYLGVRDLNMRDAVAKAFQLGMYFWVAVNAVRFLSGLIQELLERHMEHRAGDPAVAEQEKKSVRGIVVFVKIILWALSFILVMDNLGVKVSTFVAGLGITGIAVALAAQAILGDLFSYFVIFFDRPFQVGHSIKVGNFQGEVESIGIKTTRLRSPGGELIVVSNKYLTDNQVQNFRLLKRRRAVLTFEVEYGTPDGKLREIPALVAEILKDLPRAALDRCHLQAFGDAGPRFETVFFVHSPSLAVYMDIVQEFHLKLKEALDSRGIALALPARFVRMTPPGPPAAS